VLAIRLLTSQPLGGNAPDASMFGAYQGVTLMPEHRDDITAAVHDVQNQHHVILHNAVDDDIIVSHEAAEAEAQIITTPSHVRIPGQ